MRGRVCGFNLRCGAVRDLIGDNIDTAVSCDGDDRVKGTEIDTDDRHVG